MSSVALDAPRLSLQGRGLVVPQLQSEPLPIQAIAPAPCTQACPAGVNVKAYVSLIAEGRFAESLEVVRRRCPLPGICGRICHHPCERACRRGRDGEPVAIRSLKRFVADSERDSRPSPRPGPPRPERIAVIGSGPAGLTAAYDLRRQGYGVVVYEGEDEPGGMLRYGITAYRLPRDVLDAEVEVLVRAGVEIRTGQRLGRELDLERLLAEHADAVLLAVGAQRGRQLGIPNERRSAQVEDALAFLRRVNAGDLSPVRGRVVVVGGGSTAVEAARTALRLGARSVEILYRRYKEELKAGEEEIEAAEAEGIRIRYLVAPKRVVVNGRRVTALECVKVGLGEPDASGRRRPIAIPGSQFRVPCDRVLAAVGQQAELDFLDEEAFEALSDAGLMRTDPATAMTPLQGVFAAGDAVSGPATVIEAIAAGHAAAESIRHFLEEGEPGIREQHPEPRAAAEYELPDAAPLEAQRLRPPTLRPSPGREFDEVEIGFGADAAMAEARRCLRCGPCGECQVCVPSCNRRHAMLRVPQEDPELPPATAILRLPAALALGLPVSEDSPGRLLPRARIRSLDEIDPAEGLGVTLRPVRAVIREERCRGCGECVEACPFHAVALEGSDPDRARIEAGLCRGCNLCVAVCPTRAATASALSPMWWGERLEDAFRFESEAQGAREIRLACQRRAGAVEGAARDVIRFRCVGQIQAGMLIELVRLGAARVTVAGCHPERCRFGSGARLAVREVERARTLLRLMGLDPARIGTDWSPDRAHDPLTEGGGRSAAVAGEVVWERTWALPQGG